MEIFAILFVSLLIGLCGALGFESISYYFKIDKKKAIGLALFWDLTIIALLALQYAISLRMVNA